MYNDKVKKAEQAIVKMCGNTYELAADCVNFDTLRRILIYNGEVHDASKIAIVVSCTPHRTALHIIAQTIEID